MRSNIACTCGSGSVPLPDAPTLWLIGSVARPPARALAGRPRCAAWRRGSLQRPEVVHEVVVLLRVLLAQLRERRHRRRRVDERAGDRGAVARGADMREVRT